MKNNREKKSSEVFNKLVEYIKINKIKSGEVLPPEIELCKLYNVGRGSVREAMHALEVLGIVKKYSGIGTVVENFSIDLIFNPANLNFELDKNNLTQVLEFREVFEQLVSRVLIKNNCSASDMKEIEEILDLSKFYLDRSNFEKFSECDYKFHLSLADATHNIIIKNIFNLIFPFLKYIIIGTVRVPNKLDDTYYDHINLLNAIKIKNVKKADEILTRHIKHVKDFLQESKSLEGN